MHLRPKENRTVSHRAAFLIVLLFLPVPGQSGLRWEKCDTETRLCAAVAPHLEGVNFLLDRKPISAAFEAVILYSSISDEFGAFVIDRANQKHILTIAILPSHRGLDYAYEIEEVDSGSLVVTGFGATYGNQSVRKKYFFDLDAKKVISVFDKPDISIKHIEFDGETVLFAGNIGVNTGSIVMLRTNNKSPRRADYQFQLIGSLLNRPLEPILVVRRPGTALHFLSENYRYVFSSGQWKVAANDQAKDFKYDSAHTPTIGFPNLSTWVPLSKLQDNLFTITRPDGVLARYLVWNDEVSANAYGGEHRSGIYESKGVTIKFYPLPQPPFELFAKYRPRRVKDGYTQDSTIFENQVGPCVLVGKKIIFGLRFYDGEGLTGIGGYGQFDIETKEYQLNYLPEIAASSVSALLVDDDVLWMGLYGQPEGAPYSNGLISYNRKTGRSVVYPILGIVNIIRKWHDQLYIGTTQGMVLISPDSITTATLDVNKEGRNYLVVSRKSR